MKSKRNISILHTVDGDVEIYSTGADSIRLDYINLTKSEAIELAEILTEIANDKT